MVLLHLPPGAGGNGHSTGRGERPRMQPGAGGAKWRERGVTSGAQESEIGGEDQFSSDAGVTVMHKTSS